LNSVKIKSTKRKKAYHHGDLRQQLTLAAESILRERGVQGFTLREAARRAGVSPAAPAHHFKDAQGLLSEVALQGFREFGAALAAADAAGSPDPQERLRRQAGAYVKFALSQPARFQLMFLHGKYDRSGQEFVEAGKRAYQVLEGAIRAATGTPEAQPLSLEGYGRLLATWSLVHGFSHLALAGDLRTPDGSPASEADILDKLVPLIAGQLPASSPRRP
jgi:AcrR family transcriptional regulator